MRSTASTTESNESPWAFTFADRLGKALPVSGVSTQSMADALDVTRTTISNYTSGRTSPSKLQLKEWSVRTGAPLEWLLTGNDPHDPHAANAKKAPTLSGEGHTEPPAGIEPATYSLQVERNLAPVTSLCARRAG